MSSLQNATSAGTVKVNAARGFNPAVSTDFSQHMPPCPEKNKASSALWLLTAAAMMQEIEEKQTPPQREATNGRTRSVSMPLMFSGQCNDLATRPPTRTAHASSFVMDCSDADGKGVGIKARQVRDMSTVGASVAEDILSRSLAAASTSNTRMIGSLTLEERRAKVQRWLEKRRKQKTSRKETRYKGRRRFAKARPRVRGRFVKIEFLQQMGIYFDNRDGTWLCKNLGRSFVTADEAVVAVENSRKSAAGETPPTSSRAFST